MFFTLTFLFINIVNATDNQSTTGCNCVDRMCPQGGGNFYGRNVYFKDGYPRKEPGDSEAYCHCGESPEIIECTIEVFDKVCSGTTSGCGGCDRNCTEADCNPPCSTLSSCLGCKCNGCYYLIEQNGGRCKQTEEGSCEYKCDYKKEG